MSRTIRENRAVIAELAKQAFAHHQLKVVLEDEATNTFIYDCRRPGEGFYSFRVVFHPGLVVVYGDTGRLMLRGPGRDFWGSAGSVEFELDYALGKRDGVCRGPREWMPGQATAWLKGHIEECGGDFEDAATWRATLREWRNSDKSVEDAYEIIGEAYADLWDIVDDWYDESSANQWGVHALRCWARLYRAHQASREAR